MLRLPDVTHDELDFAAKNKFPVFYWNHAALEMNRATHSLGGPQTGPTMSSRALGLLHLAMHDAYFATLAAGPAASRPKYAPYLLPLNGPPEPGSILAQLLGQLSGSPNEAQTALSGAAVYMLDRLYKSRGSNISASAHQALSDTLSRLVQGFVPYLDTLSPGYRFGECVANMMFARLAVKPGEPGADQGRFEPQDGRYAFRDEPANPVRRDPIDQDRPEFGDVAVRIYHAPFYGLTAESFAVSDDALHQLSAPPVWFGGQSDLAAYDESLDEVRRVGGAPGAASMERTPDQTVAAIYWAYDGANLIGTPPRLYNQIVRTIAWQQLGAAPDPASVDHNAELIRIFALCNAAMADAGKFAWREKYKYQLWRPLSGIREHDPNTGPQASPATGSAHLAAGADPFWRALGAPETNTNRISFKPPFPAYPSGHATFGAACFQMMRLFYQDKKNPIDCAKDIAQDVDDIAFAFVSDELNGVSRDLYEKYNRELPITDQPGLLRTRIVRRFESLSAAIFENAFSRIWLGVHWNFDAFDPVDAKIPGAVKPGALPGYKDPSSIRYKNVYHSSRGQNTDFPVGGVPLGLGIANDIFCSGLTDPAKKTQTPKKTAKGAVPESHAMQAALRGEQVAIKATNTSTTQAS